MPHNPRTTIQAVADQLGISTTTVSRALNGQARRYRISSTTEKAVQDLARSLGFIPSQLARGLRLQKTLTIGLIIPDISNPFFAGIARQVTLGARKQGYSLILCDSQENTELEIQALELLRSRQVEGIVVCPVGQTGQHLLEVQRRGLPLVLADRVFPELPLPAVSSDNAAAAKEATAYLIQNGHRRITCLEGLQGTSPNELRRRGYQEALAEHAIPLDARLLVGNSFGEEGGYQETRRLLETPGAVTAILAFSNLIALGAMRAVAEAGLTIPEDLSLIAFDDQPYAAYLAAPLTSVAQPSSEMGETAARLLFQQIRQPQAPPPGTILLPTRLVVRQSVRNIAHISHPN